MTYKSKLAGLAISVLLLLMPIISKVDGVKSDDSQHTNKAAF